MVRIGAGLFHLREAGQWLLLALVLAMLAVTAVWLLRRRDRQSKNIPEAPGMGEAAG